MFQNYRNVLAYILNQTKSIDGMILDEVENLIGYAEEPDDYLRTVGDYLIKSLYNEPQVPYFDEFGAEFYELSCQEIEQELKILFEVSKYFVMKAVRNEETIKMLKTLISDLAKVGYDNYDFISNVIDTIADNYAAQNHVFMMIENLDDEIQMEIETIAKYCRKGDYRDVEMDEEPKEDGLLDILMDNGQDLLELIGIKADDDSELEEAPEIVVFEGFAEPEESLKVNQEDAAVEDQEKPQFHLFGEFEEPEDPNLNQTDENSGTIIINLVMEPKSPHIEEYLPEKNEKNTETDKILDFLVENPEMVDLLLQKLESEQTDEKSNIKKDIEIEELAEDDPEAENIVFSNFEDEEVLMKNIDHEDINQQDAIEIENMENENIETEDLNPKNSNLETINHENINVKGMVINIPYPDEEVIKNAPELEEDEKNSKKLENPGIAPEDGNFKIIFPIKTENKVDQIEDADNEDLEKDDELMMMNPKKEEDLELTDRKFEKDSELDAIEDLKLANEELEEESNESELDEDIKLIKEFIKESRDSKDYNFQDKIVEEIINKTEKNINDPEFSNDKNKAQLYSEKEYEPVDTKEFMDFEAEKTNKEPENKSSNFEKFLKIPENFWQIPLGFWQNFQNFWDNNSNSSESTKNSGIFHSDSNDNNETDFHEKLNSKDRNSRINTKDSPQDSDNDAINLEDWDKTELNLDTNKRKYIKSVNNEDPEIDEKLYFGDQNSKINPRINTQKNNQNYEKDSINFEDSEDSDGDNLLIFHKNENANKENSEKILKKLTIEEQDVVQDFPEDERTAEQLDDEILNLELLSGEILSGDNEIFEPEIDELEKENQEEQIFKDQFGFEEGIGGIDDEIVSEIKKNKEESNKNAKINDEKNSKNSKKINDNQELKIRLKNPTIPETDLDSKIEALNDNTQEDLMKIDGKVEESELKEDDFVPQFSEDDSDVKKVKIIDDENNLEEFGKEILNFFGIDENDNKEIEEFDEHFNNEEHQDLNKTKSRLKIQNLTNKQEKDNLEQERQLMLELENEKNSTKIDKNLKVDEKNPDLDENEKNDKVEEKTKNESNDEDFEGEIFDDVIENEEEIGMNLGKISSNSEKSEALDENPKKVDIKKFKNEPNQEVGLINKIKNKLDQEKIENDTKEVKEQELQELKELME